MRLAKALTCELVRDCDDSSRRRLLQAFDTEIELLKSRVKVADRTSILGELDKPKK